MGHSTRSALLKKCVPAVLAVISTLAFAWLALNRIDLIDSSVLTDLEIRWQAAKFRARGARLAGSEVVIVGMDEHTLDNLGASRAFQRRHLAPLVAKLAEAGSKVIGFNL